MNRRNRLAAALLLLGSGTRLTAQQPHPPEPAVNLGDTSFLDAVGAPGGLLEEIGDAGHSGRMTDAEGRPVPNAAAVNSISSLLHGVLLSKRRLASAWWGVETVVSAAHVNAGAGGNVGGFGDLTVAPLILQWRPFRRGAVAFAQRFVLDFEVPVGEYQPSAHVSLSSHAYTVHPYYAFTFQPTGKLETSWRVHYLYNGVNNDPSIEAGARSSQAGQAIHFNATAAYKLPHGFWAGANGYLMEQVTSPRIDGVSIAGSPEQVGAIGPGVLWDRGSYLLYVNGYHELGAVNRTEGNKLILRVQWIPGRHAGTAQTQ